MYDTILIDFFGVIDNSRYDSWLGRHGYSRRGKFVAVSNLVDAGRITMRQFFDKLSAMSGEPSEKIRQDFDTNSTLNIALIEFLKNLKGKYKIILVSNSSSYYLRDILKQYKLKSIFSDIVISGEIGMIKPNREVFEYAMDRAGASAETTVFIDDHQFNTDAAEKFGIKSVLYRGVEKLKADLAKLGIS